MNHYDPTAAHWGEPRRIDDGSTTDVQAPQIAIDIQGNAIVVWQQGTPLASNIYWNRFDSIDRRWGTDVRTLDPTFIGHALSPQVAIDSKGNAFAVWQAEDGTTVAPTTDVIADRFE